MEVFSACDIGRVREENQDYLVTQHLADGVLALVCDGMGGMLYGAEASQIASGAFAEHFIAAYRSEMPTKDVCTLLRDAAAAANRTLYHTAVEHAVRQRMGTTLVGAFVRGDTACLVNVGDSRAYLIGAVDAAQQLTLDHTVVQLLYERGDIKAEERAAHPRRNELTRAVGVSPRMLADSYEMQLKAGELLLLCSDGLYNAISAQRIAEIVRAHPPADAPAALIAAANENGGKDNISVILLKATEMASQPEHIPPCAIAAVMACTYSLSATPFQNHIQRAKHAGIQFKNTGSEVHDGKRSQRQEHRKEA